MEDEAKYLHSVNNLDDKYSTSNNCHIVDDPSIIKSYNASPNGSKTPTLSQLTTSTAILNPSSVGCQMEDHNEGLTSNAVIKNEDVTAHYVLPTLFH